jgi:hypothetical protein
VTNRRAENRFAAAGINYECEPDWIKEGRKADFYCSGAAEFWCEVKTLEPLEDFKQLGNALAKLRQRTANISLSGQGMAFLKDGLSDRDAKFVVALLKRGLSRFAGSDAPERVVAFIPSQPDYSKFVRFSFSTDEYQSVEFHSCVSTTGKYGTPSGMFPEPFAQGIRLRFWPNGDAQEFPAHQVITRRDDFRVAIVAEPDDDLFDLTLAMPTGGARRLSNPVRIREAVADANNQLKNALLYKSASCLLIVFHDGLDVPDEVIIKSALYGNLKFDFPPGNPAAGKFIADRDGAWNPDKNRSTSAVMYIRNNSEPIIVHNYWADRPFPHGVFSCKEIRAGADGKFHDTFYKPPVAPNYATKALRAVTAFFRNLTPRKIS